MLACSYYFRLLLLLICIVCLSRAVSAAQVNFVDTFAPGMGLSVRTIILSGPIEDGDSLKIASVAEGHYVQTVVLASPGGSVAEAIVISSLLNKLLIKAVPTDDPSSNWLFKQSGLEMPRSCMGPDLDPTVSSFLSPDSCGCISACALVYLTAPARMSGPFFSSVGLHRPYFRASDFAGLSEANAKRKYKQMIHDVEEFMRDNDVPDILIDRMVSNKSTQVHFLTKSEHQLVGEMKPFLEELLIARCNQHSGALTAYEQANDALNSALEAVLERPGDEVLQAKVDGLWQQFTQVALRHDVAKAQECIIKQGWLAQMRAQGIYQ